MVYIYLLYFIRNIISILRSSSSIIAGLVLNLIDTDLSDSSYGVTLFFNRIGSVKLQGKRNSSEYISNIFLLLQF